MDYFLLVLAGMLAFANGQDTSAAGCMALSKCTPGVTEAAKNDQTAELCQKLKEALACLDENIAACKMKALADAFKDTAASLRTKVDKCTEAAAAAKDDNVARYGRTELSECETKFAACITPEYLHASEHKNNTRLCNVAPAVFSCLERVLDEECPNSVKVRKDDLRRQIDRIKQRVDPNCHDVASPSSALSVLLLLVCLALGQLGLRHTSG